MLQYNFKIDETLKLELEKTLTESNSSSKSDFLANMLRAYQVQRVSSTQTNLDLSKYESVNQEAKESIGKAFKHILTLLDANSSTVKQEKIQVNDAYKALEAKELAYQRELEQLQADMTKQLEAIRLDTEERISNAENQAKELEIKNQELQVSKIELKEKLKSTSQIAQQVEFITNENQKLRESSKKLEKKAKNQEEEAINTLKNLEKTIYEQDFAIKHQEKEYKALEIQLAKIQKNEELQKEEISSIKEELNKSIGKLEILENKKLVEAKISTNKPISNSTPSLEGLE